MTNRLPIQNNNATIDFLSWLEGRKQKTGREAAAEAKLRDFVAKVNAERLIPIEEKLKKTQEDALPDVAESRAKMQAEILLQRMQGVRPSELDEKPELREAVTRLVPVKVDANETVYAERMEDIRPKYEYKLKLRTRKREQLVAERKHLCDDCGKFYADATAFTFLRFNEGKETVEQGLTRGASMSRLRIAATSSHMLCNICYGRRKKT